MEDNNVQVDYDVPEDSEVSLNNDEQIYVQEGSEVPLTKKQKAQKASYDVADTVARGLGRYYGGAAGGAMVDTALQTKTGQKVLSSASNRVARTPIVKNSLARNYQRVQRAKPIVDSFLGSSGSSDSTDYGSDASDNSQSASGSNKGRGTVTIWKKIPFKYKMIAIGVVVALVLLILFIVVLITPLMELGIIDISSSGSSGGSNSYNNYLKSLGNRCQSIIVDGKSIALDDYVAGVVSAEAVSTENIEALKAHAVATRTYTIFITNECQESVDSSTFEHDYTSNINSQVVEAIEATDGLVLTHMSKVFEVDYYFDTGGFGMSLSDAYDLAKQGYIYDEILYHFYPNDVNIVSLYGSDGYTDGLSASGDFVIRTGMPKGENEHDVTYWFSDNNASYAAGYLGQCTWYAYGRANEILDFAGSDLNWWYAPDAKYWLSYNINAGANAFSYNTDVTEPKEGAIIVWDSNQWGHVAIVEKVNDDGTIDYSEANIKSAMNSSNPYGFRYMSHISYEQTGVGTISQIWYGYNFAGYIYLVE